jgi:sulfur transfer protein SufE
LVNSTSKTLAQVLMRPSERDKLRLLLQYSRKLSAFQKRATLVQECLEEVLENGASSLIHPQYPH